MSVLIKGMEMPTNCADCPMMQDEWVSCKLTGSWEWADEFMSSKERLKDCPLVPVPPHGRLIDADAFEADRRKLYCENCERRKGKKNGKWTFVYEIGGVECLSCGIEDVLDDLEDAPTILEEEAEE